MKIEVDSSRYTLSHSSPTRSAWWKNEYAGEITEQPSVTLIVPALTLRETVGSIEKVIHLRNVTIKGDLDHMELLSELLMSEMPASQT
jgi:hypothetical protein